MKHPDYPGLSSYEKNGKLYFLFRANRAAKAVSIPGQPGEQRFEAAYLAAVQGAPKPQKADVETLPTKTFGIAWKLLQKSLDWTLLDDATQINSERYIVRFLAMKVEEKSTLLWKDAPVDGMTYHRLDAMISKILADETPAVAKFMLRDIKKLLRVALREKWISYDPSYGLNVRPKPTDGHEPWPRDVRAKFEAFHPIGSAARTCYELGMWLGNRRSDIVAVRWDHLVEAEVEDADGEPMTITAFHFRQRKNRNQNGGREMFLPVLPWLAEALAPLSRDTGTVLVTEKGTAFSDKALTMRMAVWTRRAGIEPGYTLHGLRKALGNRLAEIGLSGRQIQEVLGHSNLAATDPYVRKAEKKRLSIDAFAAVEKAEGAYRARQARTAFKVVK